MHVRVVGQRRAPRVQHQRGTDARAQVLGIGRNRLQDFCGDVEQQSIDNDLVRVSDVGDGRRQREHHMAVIDRQQVALAGIEPALRRLGLALLAVPETAGVVRDLDLVAALAARDMSTKCCGAALLDGGHHYQLAQAQVRAL